ncbi:MAG: family 10 glycosylhydrolase [Bacteroidota bacterium]
MKSSFYFILAFFTLTSCISSKNVTNTPQEEFRGVWVATVVNIDWPKNGNDSASQKKKDFVEILDFYENLNFNAIIVQVRTAGDALYSTQLAPWSKYLTGQQGKAPKDFEDPLSWMIQETHGRGMEFHAWLNPYRATFDMDTLSLDASHDFNQHRDWMIKYGKKFYYNPGLPQVRNKFAQVVNELVENHEIDAIHFDDYFYPYKIKNEIFNDSLTYQSNKLPNQSLDDWRRSNVDSLVKQVHTTIKKTKPWVQFGISPFGVWRNSDVDPTGSDTKAGQTNYDDLYANPLLWMEQGWIDYIAPQAYWSMNYSPASHRNVSEWWSVQKGSVNLYMGNGPYKIKNNSDKAWNKHNEIPKQLKFGRSLPKVNGNIFFSAKSLLGKHEKTVKKIKKIYSSPVSNPTLKIPQARTLESLEVIAKKIEDNSIQINLNHSDSLPRFALFYLDREVGSNRFPLFKKSYLSSREDNLQVDIPVSRKMQRQGIRIIVQDVYGNQTQPVSINPKQL